MKLRSKLLALSLLTLLLPWSAWKLLQELPASQRTELFYRLWSRKEAYGKYTVQRAYRLGMQSRGGTQRRTPFQP